MRALLGLSLLLFAACTEEEMRHRDAYFRNGGVSYFHDDRTDICFARWGNGGGVVVPCTSAVLAAVEPRR